MNKYIVSFACAIFAGTVTEIRGCDSREISLIKMYNSSDNPDVKLKTCVEMISMGLIKEGIKAIDLMKYLGNSVKIPAPPIEGTKRFKVHFEEAPKDTDESKAAAFHGWYLCVTIDRAGTIVDYWLSNTSK